MGDLIKLPRTYLYLFYGAYQILLCLGILKVRILSSLIDCEPSEGRVWALSSSNSVWPNVVVVVVVVLLHCHHHHHHTVITVSQLVAWTV